MKIVSAFEAKTHLSRLLRDAEKDGTEFLIQKHGRDIAWIIPASKKTRETTPPPSQALSEIRESQPPYRIDSIKKMIKEGRKR